MRCKAAHQCCEEPRVPIEYQASKVRGHRIYHVGYRRRQQATRQELLQLYKANSAKVDNKDDDETASTITRRAIAKAHVKAAEEVRVYEVRRNFQDEHETLYLCHRR